MSNLEKRLKLFEMLAKIDNARDIEYLFEDLCTKKEISNMAERLYAAELLMKGNTYNQVMARANISSATLSRVSRCVQHGKGYSVFLRKK